MERDTWKNGCVMIGITTLDIFSLNVRTFYIISLDIIT
jgi:hypothetical protein